MRRGGGGGGEEREEEGEEGGRRAVMALVIIAVEKSTGGCPNLSLSRLDEGASTPLLCSEDNFVRTTLERVPSPVPTPAFFLSFTTVSALVVGFPSPVRPTPAGPSGGNLCPYMEVVAVGSPLRSLNLGGSGFSWSPASGTLR